MSLDFPFTKLEPLCLRFWDNMEGIRLTMSFNEITNKWHGKNLVYHVYCVEHYIVEIYMNEI